MQFLRWLHLADFHVGKDNYPQLEMFKEILNAVEAKVLKGEPPDLIFITGDIANKGKQEEYSKFREEFFIPMLDKLGKNWQGRIYVVPGNHDVNIDEAKAVIKHGVLDKIPNFLDPDDAGFSERTDLLKRFSEYKEAHLPEVKMEWVSTRHGIFIDNLEIHEIKVGIMGINTAWLSDKDEDKEKLSPCISMVKEGLVQIKDNCLKIVLGHHPINWLREEDQKPIRALFGKNQVIYLHGHNHQIDCLTQYGAGEQFLTIQTGASFRVRPEDKIKRNLILWCEFKRGSNIIKAELTCPQQLYQVLS